MKLAFLLTSLYTLFGLAVAVDHMQLNFYSDWSCTKYMGEIQAGWATPMNNVKEVGYYNYRYGTSVNIAACAHSYCACKFYVNPNRDDAAQAVWTLVYGVGNWGNCIRISQNFRSYSCFYY